MEVVACTCSRAEFFERLLILINPLLSVLFSVRSKNSTQVTGSSCFVRAA